MVFTEAGSSELQAMSFREEKIPVHVEITFFSGTLSLTALLDALHILFHCLLSSS